MTREEFLALADAKYAEINATKESPTFLDYEMAFASLWTELGRDVLQANLGESGKDRRKKNDTNHVRKGSSKQKK